MALVGKVAEVAASSESGFLVASGLAEAAGWVEAGGAVFVDWGEGVVEGEAVAAAPGGGGGGEWHCVDWKF